jgi:division initiation protein
LKQGRIAIAVVSMIVGVMLVTQYRMTQTIAEGNVNLQRSGELALKINSLQEERAGLKKQIATMKEEGSLEGIKEENQLLSLRASLVDVEGPGVVLTITDSKTPVKDGENPNLYLIHDEDMLRIVNELRAAGAEAISINDQRLIGTSEIRCSGPTVTVNGKIFAPPFIIKAIGDTKTLHSALTMRGGVVESLKYWGIEVKIQDESHVTVPAYDGTIKQNYIKVKGGQ